MLKRLTVYSTLIGASLSGLATAHGAEYGSPQEARAMLDRAVAEMKADKGKAIEKFNHNDSTFRDRDLFVFCFNAQDGKFTAHEAMVAHDVRALRDETGRPFGEQMYQSAREGHIAEVSYVSPHPGSPERAEKRAYVTRLGDQVCGVSVFHQDDRRHGK